LVGLEKPLAGTSTKFFMLLEGEVKGGTVWTASQSSFVQTFLANLVVDGTKTSTGYKKVHLNACAKALNEHFKINRSGEQIANHLKTLKKKYARINILKNKSASCWDDENFIIRWDHEMYTSHFKVTTLLRFITYFVIRVALCILIVLFNIRMKRERIETRVMTST
jgi:hypothetical protein